MTWHLKDRELEEKLIAIDPKFLERINEGSVLKDNLRMDTCMMITDHVAVRFGAKDFEEVPEYNPNDWNEFPAVTPPEGVPMRVESVWSQCAYRECAIFDKGAWKNERDGKPTDLLLGEVKHFRPWGY